MLDLEFFYFNQKHFFNSNEGAGDSLFCRSEFFSISTRNLTMVRDWFAFDIKNKEKIKKMRGHVSSVEWIRAQPIWVASN